MNSEQKQQAKHLYFQTSLNKTQIAEVLHISRRSLHYWIKEGNWDRLKRSATHLPSLLAENCYHIIAHFSEHLLSETRMMKPITHQEADTLHKLALTVNKLKNRSTINENMEMFGFFMDGLNRKSPALAKEIMPHIDEYISSRASIYASHVMPEHFNDMGYIPVPEPDDKEAQLDLQDAFAWSDDPQPQPTPAGHCEEQSIAPCAAATRQPHETPFEPALSDSRSAPAGHCEEQNQAPCDAVTKQPHETPITPAGHCEEQSIAPCAAATKQPHVTPSAPAPSHSAFIFNPDHTFEEHLAANGLKMPEKLPPLDTIEQFREYQRSLALKSQTQQIPEAA